MSHKLAQSHTELAPLFFETRQLIRSKLPHTAKDHNEWMRCEILRHIQTAPSTTMREISDYLRIKAPSATSIVRLLEREGLVSRIPEEKDKRIVRIILTKKGNVRVAKYLKDARETMAKVFSKISADDVASLVRILRSLQEAHQK
jgi:DNA-binding MarR family transcriptional regulator